MFTKKFWKDLAERAISTAAQAAIGAIGAGELTHLNWKVVGLTVVGAAVLSVLKGVVASQVGDSSSASLLPATDAAQPPANP
jgi:hypothetical protein